MTDLRQAAQAALEALENCSSEYGHRCNRCDSEVDEGGKIAAALRTALAEPVTTGLAQVIDGPKPPTLEWDGPTGDDLYWRLHSLSKALESSGRIDADDYPDAYATVLDAMNALRAALAEQPVTEPVATVTNIVGTDVRIHWFGGFPQIGDKLYLAPPREPVRLTDDLIEQKWAASRAALPRYLCFARDIESAVLKANGRTR